MLIPRYGEKMTVLRPLLDSLAIQQNVNFDDVEVIIANDGCKPLKITGKYPFSIRQLECEHKGVSATRNAALDATEADYVMFCDIDDMFFHACGLWMIFSAMEEGVDAFSSQFVEETRWGGQANYITRDFDQTFVHGKVYRREYLVENNIRFNDNLTVHEDSYFNILAQSCTDSFEYCPTSFYLWKWRDDSVCRHDPKYILKTYNNMIASTDALIGELKRRGKHEKAQFFVGNAVFDAYYLMNKPEWKDQENQEFRKSTEKEFAQFFKKHKKEWGKLSKEQKMAISNGVRGRQVMEGMDMECITLDAWLKAIQR